MAILSGDNRARFPVMMMAALATKQLFAKDKYTNKRDQDDAQ